MGTFWEHLPKKKKPKHLIYRHLDFFSCTQSRDRTGMEVNPLVFETSASTNSAIWAFCQPLFITEQLCFSIALQR